MMDYPSAKFGDFSFSRFARCNVSLLVSAVLVLSCGQQTEWQRQINAILTRLPSAWVNTGDYCKSWLMLTGSSISCAVGQWWWPVEMGCPAGMKSQFFCPLFMQHGMNLSLILVWLFLHTSVRHCWLVFIFNILIVFTAVVAVLLYLWQALYENYKHWLIALTLRWLSKKYELVITKFLSTMRN